MGSSVSVTTNTSGLRSLIFDLTARNLAPLKVFVFHASTLVRVQAVVAFFAFVPFAAFGIVAFGGAVVALGSLLPRGPPPWGPQLAGRTPEELTVESPGASPRHCPPVLELGRNPPGSAAPVPEVSDSIPSADVAELVPSGPWPCPSGAGPAGTAGDPLRSFPEAGSSVHAKPWRNLS